MNNITFGEFENFLHSHSTDKIIPGLERITRLLSRLDNPQNKFKAVHIVGTNGKGSTGAFLSSVFKESGYKTGFYSSPHLESPGERLLIDGEVIPADEWLRAAGIVAEKILPDEDLPSYFELLTACAFLLAREKNIDVGIIEAGLGGKFDATNVMNDTLCSVIASVSIDHTEYLGNSLESIAGEKFAVVRKNTPACFSGNDASLVEMFRSVCAERSALPFIVSQSSIAENIIISPEGNSFDFYAPNLELKNVRTSLIGKYQISNAMLALSAISLIKNSFAGITDASILNGMLKAKWPGRLEIISHEPLIILDGGHNYDGVMKLCISVKELWPEKKIGIVYAAMRDKNYSGCLELMNTYLKPSLYVTTVPSMARALKPDELMNAAKSFSWKNLCSFEEPLEAVNKSVQENDLTLVCGSLYMIGYVRSKISSKYAKKIRSLKED